MAESAPDVKRWQMSKEEARVSVNEKIKVLPRRVESVVELNQVLLDFRNSVQDIGKQTAHLAEPSGDSDEDDGIMSARVGEFDIAVGDRDLFFTVIDLNGNRESSSYWIGAGDSETTAWLSKHDDVLATVQGV